MDEADLVVPFVEPDKRGRCVTLMGSTNGRRKFIAGLDHWRDFDHRFASRVPAAQQSSTELARLLRAWGSEDTVRIVSTNRELDGKKLRLEEALEGTIGMGHGTILVCAAGRLAYYESEEPGERYIIRLSHVAA
jgi:hypothetical protein